MEDVNWKPIQVRPEIHKRVKSLAALMGLEMNELVAQWLEAEEKKQEFLKRQREKDAFEYELMARKGDYDR